jgi:cytochrome c-type biogenesis protein CcmH/NrfF
MLVVCLWKKPITLIVVIAMFMLIKTEQCKEEARENTRALSKELLEYGEVSWTSIRYGRS